MKFSLICLAACLAVCAAQNSYYWPFSPWSFYRSLLDDVYDDDVLDPVEQRNALVPYHYRDHYQRGDALPRIRPKTEYQDAVVGRNRLAALGNRLTPDDRGRFFFNVNPFGSLFSVSQTTSYMTTTTVTAVSITSCIPISQFAGDQNNNQNPQLSTGPCAQRKRRGIEIPMDWEDDLIIDPSPVGGLEASAIAELQSIERTARRAALLQSSQDEDALAAGDADAERQGVAGVAGARQKRFFFGLFNSFTITVSTSFSFTTTNLRVTVTRGTTSALVCLPSDFIVC